jgi:hypothetical protein
MDTYQVDAAGCGDGAEHKAEFRVGLWCLRGEGRASRSFGDADGWESGYSRWTR